MDKYGTVESLMDLSNTYGGECIDEVEMYMLQTEIESLLEQYAESLLGEG